MVVSASPVRKSRFGFEPQHAKRLESTANTQQGKVDRVLIPPIPEFQTVSIQLTRQIVHDRFAKMCMLTKDIIIDYSFGRPRNIELHETRSQWLSSFPIVVQREVVIDAGATQLRFYEIRSTLNGAALGPGFARGLRLVCIMM